MMSESQPENPSRTTVETSKEHITSVAPSRTSTKVTKALSTRKTAEKIQAPGHYDVLLGRGRTFENHAGNQHFHDLITVNIDRYAASNVQLGKWKITMDIVEAVVVKGGRFLKPPSLGQTGWTVVPIEMARQKVAHSLQYHQRRLAYLSKDDESNSFLQEESVDATPTKVNSMEEFKQYSTPELLDVSIRDIKPLPTMTPNTPKEVAEESPHPLVKVKKQKIASRRVSTDLHSVIEADESTDRVSVVSHHHHNVNSPTQNHVSPVSSTRSVYLSTMSPSSDGFRSPPSMTSIQRTSHHNRCGSHNKMSEETLRMTSVGSFQDTVTNRGPHKAPQAVTPEHDANWANRQFRMAPVNTTIIRSEGRVPMMMQDRSLSLHLPENQSEPWYQDHDELAGVPSYPNVRPASGYIKRAFAHHGESHYPIPFQENHRPQPTVFSPSGRVRDPRFLNKTHRMNHQPSQQHCRSVSLPMLDRTTENPWRGNSRALDAEMAFNQSPYIADMDSLSEYASVDTDAATAAFTTNPIEWNKRKFQSLEGNPRRCASVPSANRCPPPYARSYSSDYVLSNVEAQERRLALAKLFNVVDAPKNSPFSAGMALFDLENELLAFQKFRQSRGYPPGARLEHMSISPFGGNFDLTDEYDEYECMMMQHPDFIAFCQSQEEAFVPRTGPVRSTGTPMRNRPFYRPDCDPIAFGSISGYFHQYPHDQVPMERPSYVATLPSDRTGEMFDSAPMDGICCDSLMNQPLNDDFFVSSEAVDNSVQNSQNMRHDADQHESWNRFRPEDSLDLYAPMSASNDHDANLGLEIDVEEWKLPATPK